MEFVEPGLALVIAGAAFILQLVQLHISTVIVMNSAKMTIKLLDIEYRIQQLIKVHDDVKSSEPLWLPDDWWKRGEEPPGGVT